MDISTGLRFAEIQRTSPSTFLNLSYLPVPPPSPPALLGSTGLFSSRPAELGRRGDRDPSAPGDRAESGAGRSSASRRLSESVGGLGRLGAAWGRHGPCACAKKVPKQGPLRCAEEGRSAVGLRCGEGIPSWWAFSMGEEESAVSVFDGFWKMSR